MSIIRKEERAHLAESLQMLHLFLLRDRSNSAADIPSLDEQLLNDFRRDEATGASDNSCVWPCGFSGSHATLTSESQAVDLIDVQTQANTLHDVYAREWGSRSAALVTENSTGA